LRLGQQFRCRYETKESQRDRLFVYVSFLFDARVVPLALLARAGAYVHGAGGTERHRRPRVQAPVRPVPTQEELTLEQHGGSPELPESATSPG